MSRHRNLLNLTADDYVDYDDYDDYDDIPIQQKKVVKKPVSNQKISTNNKETAQKAKNSHVHKEHQGKAVAAKNKISISKQESEKMDEKPLTVFRASPLLTGGDANALTSTLDQDIARISLTSVIEKNSVLLNDWNTLNQMQETNPSNDRLRSPSLSDDDFHDNNQGDLKENPRNHFNILVSGHVDAGKSTLVGNILVKLGKIKSQVIHKYAKESELIGKSSFFLAWIMDQNASEREHGVTIDISEKYEIGA